MKVLMIAPQPFFQPRGTPFSVLHRLQALTKLGHQIDLVTYHIGQNVEIEGMTIHRSKPVSFIKEIAIGPSRTKLLLDVFLYKRAVSLLSQNSYDLIHTHEEAGFWGNHLSNKYKTLHLYDMHSSLPQQLSNFKYTRSKALIRSFERLEDRTLHSADAVITICPELNNYVSAKFPHKFNQLIENVADNSTALGKVPGNIDLKSRYGLDGQPVILYAGTLEPYQGINLLIESSREVLSQIPDIQFMVVGGKPDQIEASKKQAVEIGVSQNFHFAGQRPPHEIPKFLELASVLVSPRLKGNNTPLKIYEYLRAGKPIVATNHLTHTQVLNQEVAVLTDCNASSFTKGILNVLRDRDLSAKVAKQAKELANSEYSYEAYLNKTRSVYDYLESRRQTN